MQGLGLTRAPDQHISRRQLEYTVNFQIRQGATKENSPTPARSTWPPRPFRQPRKVNRASRLGSPRYYALHGLVAAHADANGLTAPVAQALLRRAEVALAAVSFAHHPQAQAEIPGEDGRVRNSWGFWGPYAGSEVSLGILDPDPMPTPGPRFDKTAVRDGLGELLELAAEDTLHVDDLAPLGDQLCVCRRRPSRRGVAGKSDVRAWRISRSRLPLGNATADDSTAGPCGRHTTCRLLHPRCRSCSRLSATS